MLLSENLKKKQKFKENNLESFFWTLLPIPPAPTQIRDQSLLYILLLRLTMEMMKKYNTEKAIVFNTYQVRELIDFIDRTWDHAFLLFY